MTKEKNVYYENKTIRSPKDSADILREFIGNADREVFAVACLNTKNQISNLHIAHIGSLNESVVHPREVFKTAILSNASSIIVCHNHPSGNPQPSPEDIVVTAQLAQAGEILGIQLLDHIILGEDSHISLAECGVVN
jgi:DNA repair protein RadC